MELLWASDLSLNLNLYFSEFNLSRYIHSDNCAQFAILKENVSQQYLLVCNTHLLFSSQENQIKLCQLIIIIKALKEISEKFGKFINKN